MSLKPGFNGILMFVMVLTIVAGQRPVLFYVSYFGQGGDTETNCYEASEMIGNITSIDIERLGRRTYQSCQCSFRTTYISSDVMLQVETRNYNFDEDAVVKLSIRRQISDDYNDDGSVHIVNTNPGDEQTLPVAVKATSEDNLLDMICSEDGSQLFTTPQLQGNNPVDPGTTDNGSNEENNDTIISIAVVIGVIILILILLIIALVVYLRARSKQSKSQSKRCNKPAATMDNPTEAPGVMYAAIDPKSLAPRDPQVVAQENERKQQDDDVQLNYAEIAFKHI